MPEPLRTTISRLSFAVGTAMTVLFVGLSVSTTPQVAGNWIGLAWIAWATVMAGWRRSRGNGGWCVFLGGILGWLAAPLVQQNGGTWLENALECGMLMCVWATAGMGLGLGAPVLVVRVHDSLELGKW